MSYDRKFYTAEIMVAVARSNRKENFHAEKRHGEKIVRFGEVTSIPELQQHIFDYLEAESIEWDVETSVAHVFRTENNDGEKDENGEFDVDYQIAVWRVEIPEFEEILEEISNAS